MNKLEGKRKDWVKNALIVFLVIMLILTFFSNTIMNYSLAEVSTTYISNGTISTQIKGSGTIKAVDPYNVTISQGRKVESVNVRRGDTVEKGSVIFVLEEGDSTELTAAKKEYQDLLDSFDRLVIENRISEEVVNAAKTGDSQFMSDKMAKLDVYGGVLKDKEEALNQIDARLSVLGVTIVDTSADEKRLEELNKTIANLENDIAGHNNTLATIEGNIVSLQNSFSMMTPEEQAANEREVVAQLVSLADSKKEALAKLDSAKAEYESKKKEAETLSASIADKKSAPNEEAAQLTYKRAVAVNEKNEAQKYYDEIYNDIKFQMQLQDMLVQIEAAKENYQKIEKKAIGTEVTAPVTGIVMEVNVVAGEKVAADSTMAVIQASGKDYVMEMAVTREQAARVRVGDVAKAENMWYYGNLSFVVSAIKPDPSNLQSGNKIIVFTVSGDEAMYMAGNNVTVSVGGGDSTYDMIVPNTAIREDKNGTYILIISAKSTPLGNRYTAQRVDVTKIVSDSVNTAISCELVGYESVITTATKPVNSGDQVRLPNR